MAGKTISNVRISGIAAAVPEQIRSAADFVPQFGEESVRKISEAVGVERFHAAPAGTCTSDLCFVAAKSLLEASACELQSIDMLIFVSQTPDHILPATSCVLHGRLGLGKHCAAFDLNMGCSGYVYALWVASNLISARASRRALLLVGDTISRIVSPQDRSVSMLFGDAGTATLLEYDETASTMAFELGTDGKGESHIKVPAGMFRQPSTAATVGRTTRSDGNVRSDEDLFMDGPEVFSFTLREVPRLIDSTLRRAGWTRDDADAFVMHQANKFMLQHLAKRMQLPAEKTVLALADYGNTSSASVPLALVHCLGGRLGAGPLRLLLAGFGVGLSWAAAAVVCGPLVIPEIMLVGETPV